MPHWLIIHTMACTSFTHVVCLLGHTWMLHKAERSHRGAPTPVQDAEAVARAEWSWWEIVLWTSLGQCGASCTQTIKSATAVSHLLTQNQCHMHLHLYKVVIRISNPPGNHAPLPLDSVGLSQVAIRGQCSLQWARNLIIDHFSCFFSM